MKVGLFGARADDRGLGRLTHDFYTHMRPDRTLVIDMGEHARQFTQHLDRYPGCPVAPFNGGTLDPDVMHRFFAGLDVAVFYETAYDHRAYDIARAAGCRTVLMAMPEFHRHNTETLPHPDVVWVPTTWRQDTIPGARLVPAPVALEQAARPLARSGPVRILHVAGHRATGDRNGTLAFLRALRLLRRPLDVRVATQDGRLPNVNGLKALAITVDPGGPDHWRLYGRADLLVMPRRYGGLSLPVQEALASGLAIAMTDCEPNTSTWPVAPIPCRPGTTIRTPAGPIAIHDPVVGDLAETIERLIDHPREVAALKTAGRAWAEANSWESLMPLYQAELERALTPAPVA